MKQKRGTKYSCKIILLVITAGAICASAQEDQLPQLAGAPPAERSALPAGAAPGTDKSRACVRCEHSKLNTQDADPLGEGAWQLQLNSGYYHSTQQLDPSWKTERRDRSYGWINQDVLTYGVSDDLDLGVGLGYAWLTDDASGLASGNGLSDLTVSSKWRFFKKQAAGIAFACVPTLTVPTGKNTSVNRLGTSQEFWSLDTRFAVVKDWLNQWSMNCDIGYVAAFSDRGGYRGSFSANWAVGCRLLDWLQPEVEMNFKHDFIHGDQDADLVAMTVGLAMPLSDRVCARTGAQRGLAGRNTDQTTAILFSADVNF